MCLWFRCEALAITGCPSLRSLGPFVRPLGEEAAAAAAEKMTRGEAPGAAEASGGSLGRLERADLSGCRALPERILRRLAEVTLMSAPLRCCRPPGATLSGAGSRDPPPPFEECSGGSLLAPLPAPSPESSLGLRSWALGASSLGGLASRRERRGAQPSP